MNSGQHRKSVFISRNLEKGSVFKSILEENGFTVNGFSFILFRPVNFDWKKDSDWLFFYSKNGVKYFFNKVNPSNITCQIAALGSGTAKTLEKIGISPDFVGSGKPNEVAKHFKKKVSNQKVTFIRAQKSKKSIQKILDGKINADDLVVYNNFPIENLEKRPEEILVFTSPMNARHYFSKFKKEKYQKTVAIGRSTEKALQKVSIKVDKIADKPTEENLANAVKHVFGKIWR